MIENVQMKYKTYVVAIKTSKYEGTGFFVAPELICTCCHVIADSDLTDISVYWNGKVHQIENCSRYEAIDLAFLQTKDAGNAGWLLFSPNEVVDEGLQFQSFGFTEGHRVYGSPFLLTYTGTDIENRVLSFSQDNIIPGASGSPIVFNKSNSLVGMLSVSRDIYSPSGGRGLSASYILKCLCEDSKFYSYTLRMLQTNNAFSSVDCRWVCNNHAIKSAVQMYLSNTLINENEQFEYELLVPYLKLAGLSYCENPYIAIDCALRKEYIGYSDAYRIWLQKQAKTYSHSDLVEAIEYTSTHIMPLQKECVTNIDRMHKRLKSIRIAGSGTLCLANIMEFDNNLFVSYNLNIENKKISNVSSECLVERLNMLFSMDRNVLILSDPGGGKTIMMITSFLMLLDQRIHNLTNYLPIYINLQKETNNQQLDQRWLDSKIRSAYGDNLSNEYIGQNYSNIVLFLDGLDEYLSRQSEINVNDFFDSPIFTTDFCLHVVLSCREQYYNYYVQYNDIVQSFIKYCLLKWSKKQKQQYISAYIRFITEDNTEYCKFLNESVQMSIQNNLFLDDLSNTPLYLNMCIEVLVDNPECQITNLIDLFDSFTEYWIKREFSKVKDKFGGDFIVDEVLDILTLINWKLYTQLGAKFTKTIILNIIKSHFSTNAKQDFVRYEQLADFVVQHTFFVSEKRITGSSNLSYVHKSFMEFFVSRYVFSCISASDNNYDLIIETHKVFLSHEISELIKEHFLQVASYNVSYQKQIYNKCLNNCIQSVNYLQKDSTMSTSEKRIAQQQLIYHIGQVKLPETIEFLKYHLQHETNLWTRRTIILGLSFSGDETELTAYIERMKEERASGVQALESEVNIGFSLSFFGDQALNDLHPEMDQGYPKCRNTVIRLIQQLSAVRNRPSWHNDLYTLVDLAQNRPISKEEYIATIRENQMVLLKILNDVERFDEQSRGWPEIQQMRRIISEICNDF